MSQQDTKEEIGTPLIKNEQNIQGGAQDSFAESDGGKISYRESKQEELTEEQYLQQQALVLEFRDRKIVKYLFLTGIFSVGLCYYNNNFHGLLKEYILEKTNVSETQFQLFSTLSSGPSVPLIFFSGILLDIIGTSTGMSIYLAVMLVGGWLQVIAGSMNSFYFLVVGRVIGGIGLMMASGAESALLAKWYTGGELATYNGIYLALVRTAQLLAALLYPKLYLVKETLEFPLLIAAFIVTLAYALSMLCCIMDILADKQQDKVSKLRKVGEKKKFSLSDFKKFDSFFWTVIFAFLINYTIQYPYVQNIQTIFQKKFLLSSEQTGEIQSFAYFIGLSCPFFGWVIKKWGRRFEWLILGSLFGLASFFYLGVLPECETACYGTVLPSIIFFGLFLTFFQVVLIPAVAIAAPLELVGTAYGVAYGSKNLGEAVIPIITIGPLLDNLHVDYTIGFFIVMSLISLCLSIILWQWNKMREEEVPREKEEYEQKEDIIVSRAGTVI